MVDKLLKLLLLLSPIAYTTGILLTVFDLIFFRLGVIGLFCASLFDKPKRNVNLAIPIALVLGLCVFNLFSHSFNPIIFSYTINIFLALLSLSIIVNYASPLKEFTKWIVGAVLINISVFIVQKFGFNPILNNSTENGGIMGNAPRLASYLTIISPVLFSYSLAFIPLLLIVSLALKELTLLAIFPIYLFLRFKNKIVRSIIVGVLLLGAILLHRQIIFSLIHTRWLIWKPTLEAIFNHPLNGYGLGMFSTLSQKVGMYQVDYAMNSYLEFIFGAGLIGVVLIGLGIKKFIEHFDFSSESLSVLALLILALLEYPFEIPKLWFTIIAIVGFFIIKTKTKHREENLGDAC